ncbi:unnamed protein product [Rangifer tarandus platyrhynchus]|uniref:Uncharacterized protein n=1 Tax=Rangifer tarandus platyrhynchus TaxID=3082113 RepID=A0AC60A6J7_RANTA
MCSLRGHPEAMWRPEQLPGRKWETPPSLLRVLNLRSTAAEKAKQNNAFVSPTAPDGDGGGRGTGYRDHGRLHAHMAPQPSFSEARVLQRP